MVWPGLTGGLLDTIEGGHSGDDKQKVRSSRATTGTVVSKSLPLFVTMLE
jgi:hypothetical protein